MILIEIVIDGFFLPFTHCRQTTNADRIGQENSRDWNSPWTTDD